MPQRRLVVLDASAVVAWARREAGHDVVARLLPVAVISAPNMTEVLARMARRSGRSGVEAAVMGELVATGLRVEPTTDGDCVRAAELINQSRAMDLDGSLSLGDALCLAMGERLAMAIVGADQMWEALDLHVEFMPFR